MEQEAITQYISELFAGVDVVLANGDAFFFYDPERSFDPTRRLPFATIMTSDAYDQFSNLSRPAVFRLNIGISQATYRDLFGEQSTTPDTEPGESGYDFTVLNQIMPHPVYGQMFWLCVLNPSTPTFESLRPLLAEAYELSVKRTTRVNPKARPVTGC
jgi:hypothetical protein